MIFQLIGLINYDVGSCHDSRTVSINQEFKATDVDQAIDKARELVKEFHETYSWHTDYTCRKMQLRMITPVWETFFNDEQFYFKEKRLK